jgi:hypothetical protein
MARVACTLGSRCQIESFSPSAPTSPGLAKRRPQLRMTAELTDTPPQGWASSIDQVIVRGSLLMDEVLFFHRQSETCLERECFARASLGLACEPPP